MRVEPGLQPVFMPTQDMTDDVTKKELRKFANYKNHRIEPQKRLFLCTPVVVRLMKWGHKLHRLHCFFELLYSMGEYIRPPEQSPHNNKQAIPGAHSRPLPGAFCLVHLCVPAYALLRCFMFGVFHLVLLCFDSLTWLRSASLAFAWFRLA